MGLQVGNKSAGRSVLLRFFLYPAVENIPGEIIFYRGLHISHTRAEDEQITFFIPRAHNHWKTDFPHRNSIILGNILNWN
jgi:hypothetical protein